MLTRSETVVVLVGRARDLEQQQVLARGDPDRRASLLAAAEKAPELGAERGRVLGTSPPCA